MKITLDSREVKLLKRFLFLWIGFALSQPAAALCVSVSKAHLRKGPGTQFPKTWTVGRYMPLVRLDRKGRWYKVKDLDGEEHWLHSRLVTTQYKCLAVKVREANLRQSPGGPRAEYRSADKYSAFQRIRQKEAWYYVKDSYGQKFWIHKNTVWRPIKVIRLNY